ncbi:MAG: NAD(P)H-quinone oxidoreductase [Rickettsiales bacterium]|nr:NAD(P)H-quinone oxidoreductase [Rickettsiales bacterium]|tara:strand:+ start:71 stop:1084 length:1014 start_codon:yes stop_codon:yes gene_type:complete
MNIPNKMNYIEVKKHKGKNTLLLNQSDIPSINDDEILIKVFASGVNRPDILQRKGLYAPPKDASPIIGLEVSGKIVKLGKKVKKLKVNDKICALTHGGGYAEYCKVHYKHALSIPKGMNYVEAAAIPENFFTVWYNLIDRAKIKKNETILIHGGSSGIGSIAIQLAKFHECRVITTVGNKNKCLFCKSLGADLVINYNKDDFFKKIQLYTNNSGVDIILDMVGKNYFNKNLTLLKDKGRLIMIAFLSGSIVKADLTQVMIKRLILSGSTLRPRTVKEKTRIASNIYKSYWTALAKKTIKPIIFKIYDLKDACKAHNLMESSKHIGKIILRTNSKEKK